MENNLSVVIMFVFFSDTLLRDNSTHRWQIH